MFNKGAILYLYTETSLHPGAESSLGPLDLPIQREKHTNFPIIQSSEVKGALREEARGKDHLDLIFGSPEHAGAISTGDAKLLLFPVRSLKGVFAWITSPFVLKRFERDFMVATGSEKRWVSLDPPEEKAFVSKNSKVSIEDKVVLEEYEFDIEEKDEVQKIGENLKKEAFLTDLNYWAGKLPGHLVILHDDVFRDFVSFHSQAVTRIKLKEEERTTDAGPWAEECFPPDTLLYTLIFASKPRRVEILPNEPKDESQVLETLKSYIPGRIQLGGDETVGRGIISTRFVGV